MTVSFKQELTGVFGCPVAENPTQAMVEAAYRHHRLPWRYLTLEVRPEDLGDALRGIRAMGFRGINCTIPHKVAVLEYLDEITDSARLIGAVNCVVLRDGRFLGENTDGQGFLTSLREVLDPEGVRAVLLGAGGAARAIGVELALAGAEEILVVNRSPERGEDLARHLADVTPASARYLPWDSSFRVPEETDLLVQATSIGLSPDTEAMPDLELDSLRPGLVVADVIPNPPRTRLLREAEARGATVLDGLGMLVHQGVIGIHLWTGIEPDPTVMRAALEEVFGPAQPA